MKNSFSNVALECEWFDFDDKILGILQFLFVSIPKLLCLTFMSILNSFLRTDALTYKTIRIHRIIMAFVLVCCFIVGIHNVSKHNQNGRYLN